jgi:hypothetical protein
LNCPKRKKKLVQQTFLFRKKVTREMGCQTLTMDRVVFEQVHKVVNIHEGIIDSGNNSLAGVFSEGRAEDETANSAEAVDTKFSDRHMCICVFLLNKSV